MARLSLNKASLSREKRNLASYRRFLPSLDLKRQQLLLTRRKAEQQLAEVRAQIQQHSSDVGERLPMLANQAIPLAGLVAIRQVSLAEENVVGVHLPFLQDIAFDEKPYGYLLKPHWVDRAVIWLKTGLELRVREQVAVARVSRLSLALRKVTQRVNLFDKVLIPTAQQNIKEIQVYLSDSETAAVVRSKIAKRKQVERSRRQQQVDQANQVDQARQAGAGTS